MVKSWCVPVRKVKQRGLAMCSPPKVYAQVKLLLAQNKASAPVRTRDAAAAAVARLAWPDNGLGRAQTCACDCPCARGLWPVPQVIRQCGLNSIIPALWVEPVRGVIPGHGFRIDWLGLWADVADGASVQNIHVSV